MAIRNCSACEELRQDAPGLVCNGFDQQMCASLANNTGLNPEAGNTTCEDLENLVDCLIGNEQEEVDLYDVCDWRTFMKQHIANLWTVLKAMVCAICGLWANIRTSDFDIECIYNALTTLTNQIAGSTGGAAFVRYFRDNSGQSGRNYFINAVKNHAEMLDIYMDCDIDDPGSTPADRDYIVIISCCTNLEDFIKLELDVSFFSSGDTRDITEIRKRLAQHPGLAALSSTAKFDALSTTTTGAVLIRKGEHVKVESNVSAVTQASGNTAHYRLHQFSLTWIPVNIDSAIDPSIILNC